eukprot:5176743-Karenia_brevis.AAC.1
MDLVVHPSLFSFMTCLKSDLCLRKIMTGRSWPSVIVVPGLRLVRLYRAKQFCPLLEEARC